MGLRGMVTLDALPNKGCRSSRCRSVRKAYEAMGA
jgi:hypothetical protein